MVGRADLCGRDAGDIDARIADLHYRDVVNRAVGHNVSVASGVDQNGCCRGLRTCWLPQACVPRVIPGDIAGVELAMDALASLSTAAAARAALGDLPRLYRVWDAATGNRRRSPYCAVVTAAAF
jgi:hypothetical protein